MAGSSLAELGVTAQPDPAYTSVKDVVLPFAKFPGVDVILGPEMRSTGEVMGIDIEFPMAFARAQMAAGRSLPLHGNIFVSVRDADKRHIVEIVRNLVAMGFSVHSTGGTHDYLDAHGVRTHRLPKISEGRRPNVLDLIKNGELDLIINTPTRKGAMTDEGKIRAVAVRHGITMVTTRTGAAAIARAISALRAGDWRVNAIQDYVTSQADQNAKSIPAQVRSVSS
jgi:carbamoyl-phosphate synthase large subunit